jgi:hypothetical protein
VVRTAAITFIANIATPTAVILGLDPGIRCAATHTEDVGPTSTSNPLAHYPWK